MKSNAGMLKVTYLQKLSQPNITLVQYSRTGKATTQQKLHTLKHNSSTHYYLVTSYIYSKTYSQHSLILSQIAFTEGSPTFMIRITLTCFLQALSVSEGQNQSTVCPPVAESPPRKFGPFFSADIPGRIGVIFGSIFYCNSTTYFRESQALYTVTNFQFLEQSIIKK